jgi:hypothetical protein
VLIEQIALVVENEFEFASVFVLHLSRLKKWLVGVGAAEVDGSPASGRQRRLDGLLTL